jgi:hypothetical protein
VTTFVLDLNDAQLRIGAGANTVATAPGFAVLDASGLLLGDEAVRQFRLRPREATNLFWHRLDTSTLGVRHTLAANHADLVYRHLETLAAAAKIGPGDELIIAAPATTTTEQLSLLLGIAEGVGLHVTGIVDAAVAAASLTPLPETFLFVDVALHRFTVTRIEGGAELRRSAMHDVTEVSLSMLLEAWVNLLADRFVRETRFDPLAVAETEQQLYDQVYDWLTAGVGGGPLIASVSRQGVNRRIETPNSALVEKASQRYPLLDRALDGSAILLSHRAAALPGLATHLRGRRHLVEESTAGALFAAVARHAPLIRSNGEGLRLITRLPAQTSRRVERSVATPPTHVLFAGTAVTIGPGIRLDRATFAELPGGFLDGAAAITATAAGVRLSLAAGVAAAVDGVPAVDGSVLATNSNLEVSGARFHLIRVVDRG